jgi:hypothetical protein
MTVVPENPLSGNERLNDMPAAKLRASTILRAFHEAEAELVGKTVVLSDGKAGTVEIVSLDEHHGLRIARAMSRHRSKQRYLSGSLAAVGEAAVAIECETEMRS